MERAMNSRRLANASSKSSVTGREPEGDDRAGWQLDIADRLPTVLDVPLISPQIPPCAMSSTEDVGSAQTERCADEKATMNCFMTVPSCVAPSLHPIQVPSQVRRPNHSLNNCSATLARNHIPREASPLMLLPRARHSPFPITPSITAVSHHLSSSIPLHALFLRELTKRTASSRVRKARVVPCM